MKAIFDTSSLHALCKYYIPLDKSGNLKKLIELEIAAGNIIIIDAVFNEARGLGGGVIINTLTFITTKKYHTRTDNIAPTPDFFTHLNGAFINQKVVTDRKITPTEVQQTKNKYPNLADGRLLIFCQSILSDNPIIVTEESRLLNDGKIIKKIPINCDVLGLKCCTLPEFLVNSYNAKIVI
jgi:hypothetical protein